MTMTREEAIEILEEMMEDFSGYSISAAETEALDIAVTEIKMNSDRKKGEWIYGEDSHGQDGWFCSKCRFFVPWYYEYYNDIDFISEYKTCPHCDAKMISYTGKRSESDR